MLNFARVPWEPIFQGGRYRHLFHSWGPMVSNSMAMWINSFSPRENGNTNRWPMLPRGWITEFQERSRTCIKNRCYIITNSILLCLCAYIRQMSVSQLDHNPAARVEKEILRVVLCLHLFFQPTKTQVLTTPTTSQRGPGSKRSRLSWDSMGPANSHWFTGRTMKVHLSFTFISG